MRHALILSVALTAVAGAAAAQTRPPANGHAAGLRYLSWAGKPDAASSSSAPGALRPAAGRGAPPRVIPHAGGMAAAPAPGPVPHGLTPANAWMRPAVAAATEVAPPPGPPAPAPASPDAPPARTPAPVADPADPMAPRRDAAIFRMGGETRPSAAPEPAPVQSASASAAPPRYYSVHRQNGRQPDAIAMPASVYLDALPVELDRAPQSEDLAEPPAAPTLLRDANGRVRPAPPAAGDDVP